VKGVRAIAEEIELPYDRTTSDDEIARRALDILHWDTRVPDGVIGIRLQDQVRRLQGHVKTHEPHPIGIVKRIDDGGEFGFIETSDGRKIYFHKHSVLDGAFSRLEPVSLSDSPKRWAKRARRRAP
jgi:hypothetical protein